MSSIIKFIFILLISLLIVFSLHITILHFKELPLFNDRIVAAYIVNFLMATGIYIALFLYKKKYANQLGFLYLGGSFVKFIIFFIVFFPSYKSDGKMDILEFAAFFTPYSICLIFETLGVIKFLKKLKF